MANTSGLVTPDIVYQDSDVRIERLREISSWANNSYIISDATGAGPVIVIDAPEGSESTVAALVERDVQALFFTHHHGDHWQGYDVLRAVTAAPAYAGATETNLDSSRNILQLRMDRNLPLEILESFLCIPLDIRPARPVSWWGLL